MQFRREEVERNRQDELKIGRILASALHTQNLPFGPFSRELYLIKYQSVSTASPPMANPSDFSFSFHLNPYATPIYHSSQSSKFFKKLVTRFEIIFKTFMEEQCFQGFKFKSMLKCYSSTEVFDRNFELSPMRPKINHCYW